jgi:hypothetical protein
MTGLAITLRLDSKFSTAVRAGSRCARNFLRAQRTLLRQWIHAMPPRFAPEEILAKFSTPIDKCTPVAGHGRWLLMVLLTIVIGLIGILSTGW